MHPSSTRPRRMAVLGGLVALSLTAAACGSDDDDAADTTVATTAAPTTTAPAATSAPETTAASESSAGEVGTIVDVAAANPDFKTLVAAVQAAGLVETLSGPGPFTVFAPTDEAFAAALDSLGITADELLADKEMLASILTYHVIAGEVPSSDVVALDGKTAKTVNGADVEITVEGDTVMVNDATVTAVDIPASNGIIHVIDKVLLPPSDEMSTETTDEMSTEATDEMSTESTTPATEMSGETSASAGELGTIVDVAAGAGDFTTLVAAVQAAGLTETLSGPGPFTVFAPTDEAFAAALASLGVTADQLLADKEKLASILTYHVIAGEVPSSDVAALNGKTAETVNGADVTITVDGDTVMVNDATVTAVDIPASNGIIHVIDKVLLPPAA